MRESLTNPLAEALLPLTAADGVHASLMDSVSLVRVSHITKSRPVVFAPRLYVVAQGRKEAQFGSQRVFYDAFNYLLLTVPIPIHGRVIVASPEKPYLALYVNLDLPLIAELMSHMKATATSSSETARGAKAYRLTQPLTSAMRRLLDALGDEEKARILGPMAMREVYYYLLQGEAGGMLREFVQQDRNSFRIANVLNYIQTNYQHAMSVESLAERARMSVSAFHEHFKAVTDTSPQQYIKSIRLDEGHRRIVELRRDVGETAFEVGYSSPSQFSREFKRLFGIPPSKAVELSG